MSNEIREAVQMVLTRMETHPDDFYSDRIGSVTPRFGWVWGTLNGDKYGLNEAEIDALKQGYDKIMYRKFHDRVLESLLYDPTTDEMAKEMTLAEMGRHLAKERYPIGHTDPRSIFGNAIKTNTIYKTP